MFPVLPPPWGAEVVYQPVIDILDAMSLSCSPSAKLKCLVLATRSICECVGQFYGEQLPPDKASNSQPLSSL